MARLQDIPAIANALMDRRRYRHVPRLLARVDADAVPDLRAAAQLALGRCLMEQVRLRSAYAHFRAAVLAPPTAAFRTKAELWCAFLALFGVAEPPEPTPIEALEARIDAQLQAEEATPDARALALDLAARLARWRMSTGTASFAERPAAAARFERAIDAYRVIGDLEQALRSKSRLAVLWSNPPAPDLGTARRLYAEIEAEAGAVGCPVLGAEAALEILDIDYQRFLATAPAEPEPAEWRDRYEALHRRLAALGVAYADVIVDWARARRMLRADFAQGEPIARRCAERLTGSDEERLRQEIWTALERWYNGTGDRAAADAIRPHLQPTDSSEALPMAAAIERLAGADHAMRAGEYGVAERLAESVAEDAAAPMVRIPALLILANIRNITGRRVQALALLDPLIDTLASDGETAFLREALTMRIAARTRDDPAGALEDLERAITLEDAASQPLWFAEQLALRGHLRSLGASRLAPSAQRASRIVEDFEQAEALLAPHSGQTARVVLAKVLEYKGLHAMQLGDHRDAEICLRRAVLLMRGVSVGSKLAFTLLMHGGALIAIGRTGEADAYLRAESCFLEAAELLADPVLKGIFWRIHFQRSICLSERPQAADESSERLRSRYRDALVQLNRAADLIEAERDGLRRWSASEEIEAFSRFAHDKDALYREAVRVSIDLLGDVGGALRWVERGRGWARLEALVDTTHPPPMLGDDPQIVRDLALREDLFGARTSDEAIAIQRQIDANLDAMRERAETAAYVALRSARPPPWSLLMQGLSIESAAAPLLVVVYYRAGPQWLMFGLRADWPEPRIRQLPVDAAALDAYAYDEMRVDRLLDLSRIDPEAEGWRAFSGLLAPLADWSAPGDRICLIPYGLAHALPLHTLEIDGQPLIERNPVGHVSSLAEFHHLHHRTQIARSRDAERSLPAAVFGNPTDDLPGAQREAEATAAMLGVASRIGAEVGRDELLSALETVDLFVYCGHGRYVAEAGLDAYLRLGGGATVSARDLLGLRRVAEVVVLSACQLAVNERTPGDDQLGMSFALSIRGARHVVAAQWAVNDLATELMNTRFIDLLCAGVSPAESLRRAVLEVRQQPRWAHFYYWGAFVLHGIP